MRLFGFVEFVISDHFRLSPGHVLEFPRRLCVCQRDVIRQLHLKFVVVLLVWIAENVVAILFHLTSDCGRQIFGKVVFLWLVPHRFVALHKLTVGELSFQCRRNSLVFLKHSCLFNVVFALPPLNLFHGISFIPISHIYLPHESAPVVWQPSWNKLGATVGVCQM